MQFSKKIFPNGLRLITVPMKDNPTVTVLVLVEAGSKYETKKINGVSHFLEHMCFKGTAKRPKSIDIARELDSIGAHYNAFTSQEFTGYFAKADAKHFKLILGIVSDIYLESTLPAEEIEKEKGVIVEEIRMYRDLPQKHIHDVFTELLYGDQPAGWNIAGTEATVKSFNHSVVRDYRSRHYVAPATAVVIAGNTTTDLAVGETEKYFQAISPDVKDGKIGVVENQATPGIKMEDKKTDQTHMVLGVRTFALSDKRVAPLRVLENILGGGMSSRLFQRVREEMGAGYYIGASADFSSDHGFFSVSAGVENKRFLEVVSAIIGELKNVKISLLPKAELQKAKDHIAGSLYLGLETSDSIADFYGFQEVMKKKIKTPAEFLEEINKVTAADILSVANDIFQDAKLNLAAVGPVGKASGLKDVLRFH
ncbi:MAG: Peptidase M16 domain protein [Candidatus Beckwithbacteria bacterium GW2011_GWC2_47_9]|uniref:Peptidase M16 domain protein n=2 Tax=Patescibacteria group TaxID=1783273 RepID=A0A0G1Q7E7_9BACT|nr:MAG: Peptidase M16 domain protein [Parcubacteria group bacterium GW2011_GWB1_44_7]KKU04510.1 MAG: Peptidase M16 domain protein [Candidatus Giovannonibacteria bacterium GW2011_GWA2_45_21]KKU86925.1 MAG: Peptidase M16 domain protein [Candidatus Beckwithbacteria bacterium GW2011_GWC2_47_9]